MNSKQKEISVFEPNFSLKKKIGNINISTVLNDQAIMRAQKVVESSSDYLKKEISDEISQINEITKQKNQNILSIDSTKNIIPLAFSIKSHAGICGYPLISTVAKSLYLFCEAVSLKKTELNEQESNIVSWHIDTISIIFDKNITENESSTFGKGLVAELVKIKEKFTAKF